MSLHKKETASVPVGEVIVKMHGEIIYVEEHSLQSDNYSVISK